MKQILLGLILLGAPATARAGLCDGAQTQIEFNECTAQEAQDADVALNEAYRAAMSALKDLDASVPMAERGAAAALLAAQRAWITVRDQTCIAQGFYFYGGTARQAGINGCLTLITQARTEDLWRLVQPG